MWYLITAIIITVAIIAGVFAGVAMDKFLERNPELED